MSAAEQDLRGDTAIAIMALLTWAEFHGGRTALIDGTIERFVTAGGDRDPQISRALANAKSSLARYLQHQKAPPKWLPASVLALINEPWCAAEVPCSDDPEVNTTPNDETDEDGDGFSHYR